MIDSSIVLNGQTYAYSFYCLAIIALVGWFGYQVTRPGKPGVVRNVLFYSFTAMLVVLGVSLHIVTYMTIPWSPMDLNRNEITPDRVVEITVENHQFILPAEKIVIRSHEKVLFKVKSNDLTYGFGLFRPDNSMVFQMQVLPGHMNDILWQFNEAAVLTIRSTEYSGPKGFQMIVKNAVEIVD
jgi:cytochrome c oxidase subunit 2